MGLKTECRYCGEKIVLEDLSPFAQGSYFSFNNDGKRHVCKESLLKYGKWIKKPRGVYNCQLCKEIISGPHWFRNRQNFGSERYHADCVGGK